jgi:hypothetical protein
MVDSGAFQLIFSPKEKATDGRKETGHESDLYPDFFICADLSLHFGDRALFEQQSALAEDHRE